MNIKFVLKYLLLGILTSTIIFSVVNFSNYYFMNRYPYASNLYNEAFKLYNAGVLEKYLGQNYSIDLVHLNLRKLQFLENKIKILRIS